MSGPTTDHIFGDLSPEEAAYCRLYLSAQQTMPSGATPFVMAQMRLDPARIAYFLAFAREIGRGTDRQTIAAATGALIAKIIGVIEGNIDRQTARQALNAAHRCIEMSGTDAHVCEGFQSIEVDRGGGHA